MDMFSRFLKAVGVKVHESAPASPGATTEEVQTNAVSATEVPDPSDYSLRQVSLDMVRGSQPTELHALSGGEIAPSTNNGAELKIRKRFGTRAPSLIYVVPFADRPIDSDNGNKERLDTIPIAPIFRPPPYGGLNGC